MEERLITHQGFETSGRYDGIFLQLLWQPYLSLCTSVTDKWWKPQHTDWKWGGMQPNYNPQKMFTLKWKPILQKDKKGCGRGSYQTGKDDSVVVEDCVLWKNIHQEQRKMEIWSWFIIYINHNNKHEWKRCWSKNTKRKNQLKKMNIDHLKKYVEIQPWIPAKWIAGVLRFPSDPQSPTFTLRPQSDPLFLSLQSCNTTSFKSPISVSIDFITVKFQRQHTERHLHTSRSYASIGLGWPFEKWWCIQLLIRPW